MESGRKLVVAALPPGPAFLEAWDAAWREGAGLLPTRPDLADHERERLLAALRPHELWTAESRVTLPDPAPLDPRTDLVVVTSGSSGVRKGVELSRTALEASAAASLARLDAGDSPWLCCLPLDHVAGLQVVLRARLAGAQLRLLPRFDLSEVAAQLGGAWVSLVPTMLARLLDIGAPLSTSAGVLLGGAAPPAALLDRARAAGIRLVVSYGMTETSGGCVYDGVPLDAVEAAVGEDLRVRLRGPALFHGYRLDAERTAESLEGGWLRTADIGRWSDGRLEVLGRADDIVVTGGENVSTDEVGRHLSAHPDVREAAAFGVPDEAWGQRLVAAVVPRDPSHPPRLDDVKAFVRLRAPAHFAPRGLLILQSLPRTGLGKVDRAALQRLADS
jgi:O-succinylbenzoic acid--CoA ligase